jgi:glycine cleavage system aminomethyltransferase T
MSELSRTSALASRHRELGSGLEDWNGMGTAWSYHSDPDDEHDAIRDAAGLFDMSLALVHLQPQAARPGTRLQVAGDDFSGTARVEKIPFFDPGKTRTHA